MVQSNCPYGDDSLVVADYLAGRLSGAKAQAFEAHSFGCERCFGELQRAAELRAALPDERPAGARERRPLAHAAHRFWPPLGAAAAVVLALGLWFAQPLDDAESPVEPVYRDGADDTGGEHGLRLVVRRDGDGVSLSWTGVEGADRYQVRVYTEGGDPVFEEQTAGTSIELSAAAWQEAGPSGRFYGQVIAQDELRQIIARSAFEPL